MDTDVATRDQFIKLLIIRYIAKGTRTIHTENVLPNKKVLRNKIQKSKAPLLQPWRERSLFAFAPTLSLKL